MTEAQEFVMRNAASTAKRRTENTIRSLKEQLEYAEREMHGGKSTTQMERLIEIARDLVKESTQYVTVTSLKRDLENNK